MGCSGSSKSEVQGNLRVVKTLSEFQTLLKEAGGKLVVVDFFTTWCPPCKAIAPKFAELSESMASDAIFLKVDCEKNAKTATNEKVQCYPTFLFYKNGEQVHKIEGADANYLKSCIEEHK